MKLYLFAVFVLACMALPCTAQRLADELRKAGIPDSAFNHDELAQTINSATSHRFATIYLAYMRVDANNLFTGLPQVVSYDLKSGTLLRGELHAGEKEECCGSPDGIDFTRDFILISFHDTPSASTVLVVDQHLHLVETFYGFYLGEVAPDVVAFTENMIHFAPVHSERLRTVDLQSGKSELLYPSKNDPMRAAFAEANEKQLPPSATCEKENLPCDPAMFDETVQLLSTSKQGHFTFRVTRSVWRPIGNNDAEIVSPYAVTHYVYQRAGIGWRYCQQSPPSNLSSIAPGRHAEPDSPLCEPTIPVIPDPAASKLDPFPAVIRKVN